jgi:hypothetical protein
MATTFSASLRPTRTRILLIALAVAVVLGGGLFTAQHARSATLTKKAFAGVKVTGGAPTLVHPSHVTRVTSSGPGSGHYTVTFDRHVDNCSFSMTVDVHGGSSAFAVLEAANGSNYSFLSTSDEVVQAVDSAAHTAVDTDFDIIALCPGT